MQILVLDIGGTTLKYLIHDTYKDESSEIESFSTREIEKEELLLKISQIINKNKINIVSASSPGAIINKTYVSGLTGIKGYSNFDFKEELLKKVENKNLDVFLINDANAALMSQVSNQNKHLDLALVSIGTGIGGSLFIDGKIREGKHGLAGEFGYQFFDDNDN
ncbi:ROK family protein, partial [Mycoplasma marinum]